MTNDRHRLDMQEQVELLKRQVRQLRYCIAATLAIGLIAATSGGPLNLRVRQLTVTDAAGRDRIILAATGAEGTPQIHLKNASGVDRVLVGQQPDPVIDGKRYPRVADGWGILIYDRRGDERGAFANLDNGRSILSLDRGNAEGIYLTVNEKSGFAGLVGNFPTNGQGHYAEAFRLGTLGNRVFAQATNKDGSPAGAIAGGAAGRLQPADVIQK